MKTERRATLLEQSCKVHVDTLFYSIPHSILYTVVRDYDVAGRNPALVEIAKKFLYQCWILIKENRSDLYQRSDVSP